MAQFRIAGVGADNPAEGLMHADLFGVPTFVALPERFETREEWAEVMLRGIDHFDPDLVVLAGFMKILPPNFVRALSPNLINIHPSLLPDFKGAHAVRDALNAGATVTGCTVHVVDEGVDTGPILAQAQVEISPEDSEVSLHEKIKVVEHELLVNTVKEIAYGRLSLVGSH